DLQRHLQSHPQPHAAGQDADELAIQSHSRGRASMHRSLFTALVVLTSQLGFAQLSPSADWATHVANGYRMVPNVTYLTAGGIDLKLDVYQKRNVTTPQPTLLYMHGGFWVAGNKEAAILSLLPW